MGLLEQRGLSTCAGRTGASFRLQNSRQDLLTCADLACKLWPSPESPYAAADVEEITARTGNYKKFAVFARMLLAALRRDSNAVAVDLLTYADLEALRARRAGGADQTLNPAQNPGGAPAAAPDRAADCGGGAHGGEAAAQGGANPGRNPDGGAPAGAPGGANKRYLIMTYAAEYDRVHYPLPLAFEARPDPESLRSTIAGLRAELDAARLVCRRLGLVGICHGGHRAVLLVCGTLVYTKGDHRRPAR